MKPVDQTIFNGVEGNCLAACVASLLEIPLETVPNFCALEQWYYEYACFLRDHGYSVIGNRHFPEGPFPDDLGEGVGGLFIGAGISPRNLMHAIIIDGRGNLIHDPHPSRAGVAQVTEVDIIERITEAASR